MSTDARRYARYLSSERDAGRMYRALAQLTDGDRAEALNELADIEDRHAAHWEAKLREAGLEVPTDSGRLDSRSAALLDKARRSSLGAVLPDLEAAELQAQGDYDDEPAALPGMAADEHRHAQVLHDMQVGVERAPATPEASPTAAGPPPVTGSGMTRTPDEVRESLNRAEPWHRTDKSGSLRAAVFGVSDGLVSNTALVMGFAGSGIASSTVRFAGLAGLLAGAFSMAAGEFVSVSSQRDMFRREIAMEAQELREKPL
ncbi:MAG: VIT1/CCC1 transporter family protein, partial [Actinomycetes bacterium]